MTVIMDLAAVTVTIKPGNHQPWQKEWEEEDPDGGRVSKSLSTQCLQVAKKKNVTLSRGAS